MKGKIMKQGIKEGGMALEIEAIPNPHFFPTTDFLKLGMDQISTVPPICVKNSACVFAVYGIFSS